MPSGRCWSPCLLLRRLDVCAVLRDLRGTVLGWSSAPVSMSRVGWFCGADMLTHQASVCPKGSRLFIVVVVVVVAVLVVVGLVVVGLVVFVFLALIF